MGLVEILDYLVRVQKRIVDFKIKSWAEPFLVLRAALYEDEMSEEMKNRFNSGSSSI
jgi:hypothetical protein